MPGCLPLAAAPLLAVLLLLGPCRGAHVSTEAQVQALLTQVQALTAQVQALADSGSSGTPASA